MQTKIVYTLVSSDNDYYLEQAYVSMCSVKYHEPFAEIVLVVDSLTKKTFAGERNKLLKFVNDIVEVELDKRYDAKKRSRILKSSVRKYVKGKFLYVDSDTLIVSSLNHIDQFCSGVSACYDSHSLFRDNPYRRMCIKHGKLLEWPIEYAEEYFNSGVILVDDSESSYRFYERWSNLLLKSFDLGIDMDQPSFAKANYELGNVVKRLDDVWNCQLRHGIKYLNKACIIHYLTTNKFKGEKQLFLLNEYAPFEYIRNNYDVSEDVRHIMDNPFDGLAEVSDCFAGKDLLYFRSGLYYGSRAIFDLPEGRLIGWLLRKYFKLRTILN